MRKQIVLLIALFSFWGLLIGCAEKQNGETGCIPPPETFTEKDLVGTWRYGLDDSNDTLIIREDGTYKQIIHKESQSFDYESEWLPWWVEYMDIGIPYLHLEGMRLCVVWGALDCETVGGGEGKWIDYCYDRSVELINEGVLTITGVQPRFTQPPRGFHLAPFDKSYDGVSPYYLVEP